MMQVPAPRLHKIATALFTAVGTPEDVTATTALVSGHWGWGQMTAAYGTEVALRKAKESKIAAVGLVECNHVGRLGEYSERALRAGLARIGTLGGAGRAGN